MIPSVGKPKIEYKDHNTVNFESLDFYITLAKKIIAKTGSRSSSSLTKKMLKDEDAIAFVANALMMGDWRWKDNEEKNYKSLYSYRNQCGIWAIKTYLTKFYKSQKSKKKMVSSYSLNHNHIDDGGEVCDMISDSRQSDPVDLIIEREDKESLSDMISKILESDILSDKQKDFIRLYYFEDMTLEKIGNIYGVTREAIRQSIKVSLEKIRSLI
jgi:RNA polymerase sigma factor (sigma-70 family)